MIGIRQLSWLALWFAISKLAAASAFQGQVTFGGLPLPGATVTVKQGGLARTAISDGKGLFEFSDLPDGKLTVEIEMQCFAPVHDEVIVSPDAPEVVYKLELLDNAQLQALAEKAPRAIEGSGKADQPAQVQMPQPLQADKAVPADSQAIPQEIPKVPEENEQSADGFLVQGSEANAATSQFTINPSFGNSRSGSKARYTGGFGTVEGNSAVNAQPYTLSGAPTATPAYNNFTGLASLQGPLNIPDLLPNGPNFFASYQWTRNSSSVVLPGLVPTQAERGIASNLQPLGFADLGSLCGSGFDGAGNCTTAIEQIHNPFTGEAYPYNRIPITSSSTNYVQGDVSPQSLALLTLYPLPNIPNFSNYNYQAPVLNATHQDSLQSRLDKNLGRKNNLSGAFAFQSTRSDSVNLFGFVDRAATLGVNAGIHWSHQLKPHIFLYTNFTFSWLRTELTPNFANRENVSGAAGITGNDQDASDWGPPTLNFSSFTGLSDGNSSYNRNRTGDVSAAMLIYRGKHNIVAGSGFRKQDYNDVFQQNPRGAFTFNGSATGSELADFLVGVPDTSSIAYGNANKYFRQPVYNAFMNDNWRVMPILTINAGLRWDYSAPITELSGNLVNLDVSDGFATVGAVAASDPVGPVTGQHYPASLLRPERRMIEPRIGVTWRPVSASTVVIRAGYGLYPDTSVYQNIVLSMAQQTPATQPTNWKTVNASDATCPLTLKNGFPTDVSCSSATEDPFGIDPNFRIGYAQAWQLSVQRDLPFAMQATATYSGIKGTHGPQEILPNTHPLGSESPCPSCPSGFVYETSNGKSIREAGQFQLRRRLRSGFAASINYTFAKSVDDDSYLGGQGHSQASSSQSAPLSYPSASIAQNWLDPKSERSRSSFDQRQLMDVQAQYATGHGIGGGTLMGGWRGRTLKEWTLTGNLTLGTGTPETPIYPAAVPGTAFSDVLRPALTGESIYSSGSARLNAAAYAEPLGEWGTAPRDSIRGPSQFAVNSAISRTFRLRSNWTLDTNVSVTNALNHPVFASWNSVVTSRQFGEPASVGGMRSLQTTLYLRWQ
jgi:hypothetical protein